MGFRPEETHYKLRFADAKYAGLEVTCSSISVDDFTELIELSRKAAEAMQNRQNDPDAARSATRLLDAFSGALVEWNVEAQDGTPVPANRQGVGTQQLSFILAIVNAWMDAIGGVSDPLSNVSSSGETSLGLSSMMEVSSPSQPS